MLAALAVKDLVLVETAVLEFAPGLNVLTGETGAGKSILLDALGLAIGGRGSGRASVRPGAPQGSATAVFEVPAGHEAWSVLAGLAISGSAEIVLRRTLAADGRTRAFVNDEPVGVALLKDAGAALLEIHGQADDRGLFDSGTHRRLLDTFGGHEGLARDVGARFALFDRARQELDRVRAQAAAATADADYVRAAARELSLLDPKVGELDQLIEERSLLANATRVAEDISAVLEGLEGERSAGGLLASALKRVGRLGDSVRGSVQPAESALEQAYALTQEARERLEAFLTRLEFDSGELERKDDRIHALRATARKYGVSTERLPSLIEEFNRRQEALEQGGAQVERAAAALASARAAFLEAAGSLSTARRRAAAQLERAVAAEFVPLKLGSAKFRVSLAPMDENEAGASGLERVTFEIATVEGAGFGPLAKIASGGELARCSLALKVALAESSEPAALVFDEVDRGVGGAVADAVGERLQRLAEATQVLLVTHSPQVAARAERHFRIVRDGNRTIVAQLSDEERRDEIARMLSGARVTAEARAAATRLMAEARVKQPGKKKRA